MPSDNTHFRDLKSFPYNERPATESLEKFYRDEIAGLLDLRGYKRRRKHEIAVAVLDNLVRVFPVRHVVADTRNESSRDDREVGLRIQVWDAYVKAGFVEKCLGSEMSKKVTRYAATGKLLRLRDHWQRRLVEQSDELEHLHDPATDPVNWGLIVIHTGKRNPVTGQLRPRELRKKPISLAVDVYDHAERGPDGKPDPQAIENGLAYWRARASRIEKINSNNLNFSWKAFCERDGIRVSFQPGVALRQVHAGRAFRAVRLYTFGEWAGQNLSKAQRKELLIDGEPACEFDFGGMAPRMLYHFERIPIDGDVYRPTEIFFLYPTWTKSKRRIARDLIKAATNICLNVRRKRDERIPMTAIKALNQWIQEHPRQYNLLRLLGTDEEDCEVKELFERIITTHPKLEHRFFTDVGSDLLMTTDGGIMLDILGQFADAKKPALGIHDSVVCRRRDAEFCRKAMEYAYGKFIPQFPPVIKQVF